MRKTRSGYYRNQHSCFLLQYHLVLITKYRHPVISGDLESFLKEYTQTYFSDRELIILAIEAMPDHIHILFETTSQINIAEMVNAFKSASSRMIRKRFSEELRPWYWKPYFWSLSYFIGTVSEASTAVVEKYIQNQKK